MSWHRPVQLNWQLLTKQPFADSYAKERPLLLQRDRDTPAPDPEVPGGLVRDLFFGQPHFFRIDLRSTALEFTAQRVELALT